MTTTGQPQAGDFAVIRTRGWKAAVIRVVTRSHYNHACFFISADEVVEAEGDGARRSPWSTYAGATTATSAGVPTLELTPEQRAKAPDVGTAYVGVGYNWLDLLSVGLLQYGIRFEPIRRRVQDNHLLICSQLVDQARLDLGDHLFTDGRTPQDVTPGDLAGLIGPR